MHGGDSFECQPKHKSLSEINLGSGSKSSEDREKWCDGELR